MTDNERLIMYRLDALADESRAIRDDTRDTRERVIKLESMSERVTRVEKRQADTDEEVADLRVEVGGAGKRAGAIASVITAIGQGLVIAVQQWSK